MEEICDVFRHFQIKNAGTLTYVDKDGKRGGGSH